MGYWYLLKVDIKAACTSQLYWIILTCLDMFSYLVFISPGYRSSNEWQEMSEGLTDHSGIS